MRVLVVEDDVRLCDALRASLEGSAFVVDVEADGEVAHFRGDSEDYDAVLLDLGLPSLDGLTVMQRWRTAGRNMPIIILTARDAWQERVEAIEAGADDYLVKPFRMEELLARLRAVVRRANGFSASRMEFSGYVLDTRLKQLSQDGVLIELTPQEYKLLAYLVLHRGEVISQLQLTEHIMQQEPERSSNSIEVVVGRLRKLLGRDVIKTKRGFGYFIESQSR
jgi:two-component system OmpR family response regulator